KLLKLVEGHFISDNATVCGYEIHMGISKGPALNNPAIQLPDKVDGVVSDDNQIMGTYLHGLFDQTSALTHLLKWSGLNEITLFNYEVLREQDLDRLAEEMKNHIDIDLILDKSY
ncbi:MAG: cobyric acid synthase CobQ, partial [Gammaproteobacteria bacterium]|nr:cobyric acid synthase CobQ [Gammaproteobacteria bacterium]